MANMYSMEIVNALKDFLDKGEWNYDFKEDHGVFVFGLSISNKIKNLRYYIHVHDDSFTVYAVSAVSADENDADQIARIAEFVCRANYGMKNGNFELDFNDGELRFKCYINCAGTKLSEEMVKAGVLCPAAMFTRYGDGIINVLFKDADPKYEVMTCEVSSPFEEEEDSPEASFEDEEDSPEVSDDEKQQRVLELLRMLREEENADD